MGTEGNWLRLCLTRSKIQPLFSINVMQQNAFLSFFLGSLHPYCIVILIKYFRLSLQWPKQHGWNAQRAPQSHPRSNWQSFLSYFLQKRQLALLSNHGLLLYKIYSHLEQEAWYDTLFLCHVWYARPDANFAENSIVASKINSPCYHLINYIT